MLTVTNVKGRFVIVLGLMVVLAGCDANNVSENTTPGQPQPMTTRQTPIEGPVYYVALGDSTGAGVGAREGGYVARLFRRILTHQPESKLTNYCVSGATTSDVLREQLDPGISAKPNLVTLGIGINDIGHGVSIEEFSRNYEQILTKLESNTQATIVVTNIPDISSAPRIPPAVSAEYHQFIVEFNRTLQDIASKHQVVVVDVYTITHEQLPLHPEYFSADGFHPSDKGYELWAEQMWPMVAQSIGLTSD
jgi:acyl-CoA thioesterase-1